MVYISVIITQEKSAKLLGIQFDDRQTWTNQGIVGIVGIVGIGIVGIVIAEEAIRPTIDFCICDFVERGCAHKLNKK